MENPFLSDDEDDEPLQISDSEDAEDDWDEDEDWPEDEDDYEDWADEEDEEVYDGSDDLSEK